MSSPCLLLCHVSGYFVPFTYISDMATSKGISRHDAVFLISIIGISTTAGRILLGWIADRPWVDAVTLHICEVLIGGVAIIICPLMKTYPIMGTFIFVFGFFTCKLYIYIYYIKRNWITNKLTSSFV